MQVEFVESQPEPSRHKYWTRLIKLLRDPWPPRIAEPSRQSEPTRYFEPPREQLPPRLEN